MDSDEREGCRSLVCDVEGIIVAEMVYRCLVCQQVSNSTSEAKEHYHHLHMQDNDDDDDNNNAITTNNNNDVIDDDLDDVDELIKNDNELDEFEYDYYHYHTNLLNNYVNNNNNNNYNDEHTFEDTGYYGSEEGITNNRNPLAIGYYESSLTSSKLVKRNLNNHGNRSGGSGGGVNNTQNTNVESCTRSGYIKCPVCESTRYYTTLQRRYGQFTCVACYRFFKEFFTSPRKYECNNLGSCSLDVKSRCKACWLHSCLNTYTIDSKRRSILETFKPMKGSESATPLSIVPVVSVSGNKNGKSLNNSITLGLSPVVSVSGNNINKLTFNNSSANKRCKNNSSPYQKDKNDEIEIKQEKGDLSLSNNTNNNNNNSNNNNAKDILNLKKSDDKNENSNEVDENMNDSFDDLSDSGENLIIEESQDETMLKDDQDDLNDDKNLSKDRLMKTRVKNWCCLQCDNCLADDCGHCINCLDRPKFGGPFVRKQRCINRKCLRKSSK